MAAAIAYDAIVHTVLQFTVAFVATASLSLGQGQFALTGFGYSVPSTAITAAPGQILMFSITGVQTRLEEPLAHHGYPFPLELGGISVSLVQSGRETAVPLFGVQQSGCRASNCTTQTSITIQTPYELSAAAGATLVVHEKGTTVGMIPVNALRDSIRLVRDCELRNIMVNTLIGPTASCLPRILNVTGYAEGRGVDVSLQNQPKAGDHLMMGAFGLGESNGAETGQDGKPNPLPAGTVEMTVEFGANLTPRRRTPGSAIQAITPYYIGLSHIGVYQIDFPSPALPAGTPACDGKTVLSNATVTIAGRDSLDAVQLCLQ